MSTASNATATEEDADYVEFTLGGDILKGWLWRSPFKNGDDVEVAAKWENDHYEIFGVTRPIDKTISLYPHCSRSKTRHLKNAFKWWFIFTIIFQIIVSIGLLFGGWNLFIEIWHFMLFEGAWCIPVGLSAVFAVAAASMANQWMPFVKVAEKIFFILNLPDPKNIDLVKSSKNQRNDQDTIEFGSMYFRY